jgi:RimJ/RimL family protein N-acetyltransferase
MVGEYLKGAGGDFGFVRLAVLTEPDMIVGVIGAKARLDAVEIVYGVAPAWRGRGLATGMLGGVTAAAVDRTLQYELVIAADNAASIRVAEKCGYGPAGTRRTLVAATGEAYTDLVYKIPASSKPSEY